MESAQWNGPLREDGSGPDTSFNRAVNTGHGSSRLAALKRTVLRCGPPFPRPRNQRTAVTTVDTTSLQKRFKDTFSRPVKVHFLGAWDTVSSVGFIRDKTLPGTTDGMQNVCFFRHALAMHEYRVKFLPEYANGGAGPDEAACRGDPPHTKEVWFIGSHSDIGGGSTVNTTLNKFGPALRWMSFEADLAGLKIKAGPQEWESTLITDSMSWFYKVMEYLPIKRLSYKDKHDISWLPNLCNQRRIRPGQLIHETVLKECEMDLSALRAYLNIDCHQENDAYSSAETLREIPFTTAGRAEWMKRLATLQDTVPGRQSLLDLEREIWLALAASAKESGIDARDELHLLEDALVYRESNKVLTTTRLSKQLRTADQDTYWTYPFALRGHEHIVRSIAFLSQQLVVSASWDKTLRIWNIETGEAVGDPLRGHTNWIHCVAVSPDGSLVASGSEDGTMRTWMFDTGKFVGVGLVMKADGMSCVRSVAFSPDGLRIVSGSVDGALRMWDVETGQQVGNAMEGHTAWVQTVAFSPFGSRVTSGSSDQTVRLWDAKTFQPICDPLNAHTDYVRSVAFSPEDITVAYGSDDNTIRIWNTDTGQLTHTLEGHSSYVRSVAFSPSGRHIVSASLDNTVRIWDAATGATIGVLKGHTSAVFSAAFSPDGTRIASGSADSTVRIWDRIPV